MSDPRAEFTRATKLSAYRRALGRCEECGALFGGRAPHYDHRVPCGLGGGNDLENCQVLCVACHTTKTSLHDLPRIAKANRIRDKHIGIRRKNRSILSWRKFDGSIVHKPKER